MTKKEAQHGFGTIKEAHPSVKSSIAKGMYISGSIHMLNHPSHKAFEAFYMSQKKPKNVH